MNKYVDAWQRLFNSLMLTGGRQMMLPEEAPKRGVPRKIVKARRAANYRARASRRVNRFMAKGKHL